MSLIGSSHQPPPPREIIAPYLQHLGSIPRKAWKAYWKLYADLDRYHDKTAVATIMHRLMVHVAQQVSAQTDGLEYREPYPGMHVVTVEQRIAIRFKKLDENHRRANVETEAQEDINLGQLSLFGGRIREWITVGYMPDETRTKCLGIWAVKHGKGGDPTWKTKIEEEEVVDHTMADLFGLGRDEPGPVRNREEHAPLRLKQSATQRDEPTEQEIKS